MMSEVRAGQVLSLQHSLSCESLPAHMRAHVACVCVQSTGCSDSISISTAQHSTAQHSTAQHMTHLDPSLISSQKYLVQCNLYNLKRQSAANQSYFLHIIHKNKSYSEHRFHSANATCKLCRTLCEVEGDVSHLNSFLGRVPEQWLSGLSLSR